MTTFNYHPHRNASERHPLAAPPKPTEHDIKRQKEELRLAGFRPDHVPVSRDDPYPYRSGDLYMARSEEPIPGWERTDMPPVTIDYATGRYHSHGARLGNTAVIVYQFRKV